MGWRILKYEDLIKSRSDRPDQWKHGAPRMLIPTDTSPEYVKLMRGRGNDHLSGWVAIVAYWACQDEDKREDGKLWCGDQPATVDDIAETRFLSVKTIEMAIDKLLEIKWLGEWFTNGIPSGHQGEPVVPSKEGKGKEGKERESKEKKGKEKEDIFPVKILRTYENSDKPTVAIAENLLDKLNNPEGHDAQGLKRLAEIKSQLSTQYPAFLERCFDAIHGQVVNNRSKPYPSPYSAILDWGIEAAWEKWPKPDRKKQMIAEVCKDLGFEPNRRDLI